MKTEFPLESEKGLLFVIIDKKRALLDTGAPTTFGHSDDIEICGNSHLVHDNYIGRTAGELTRTVGIEIDFLLGTDILAAYFITLDLENNTITFDAEHLVDTAGEVIPTRDVAGIPIIELAVEGVVVPLFFDTGATLSYLDRSITMGHQGCGMVEDFYPELGYFNTQTYSLPYLFGRHEFDEKFGNLPDELEELMEMGGGVSGILGNAICHHGVVELDIRSSKMAFTRKDDAGSNTASEKYINLDQELKLAQEIIESADAVLITAGAGMSADSGLATFRTDGGWWKNHPLSKKHSINFMDLVTVKGFESDPRLSWAFFGTLMDEFRNTAPHRGYTLLLELAKSKQHGAFVITSNGDELFEKAGFDADSIHEVHGSAFHLQCAKPCTETTWEFRGPIPVNNETFKAEGILPICPYCSGPARPNALMFGEDDAWVQERESTQEQRLQKWLEEVRLFGSELVVIEIGAGTQVPTIRIKSQYFSKLMGGQLIRINLDDAELEGAEGVSLPMNGLEACERLLSSSGP